MDSKNNIGIAAYVMLSVSALLNAAILVLVIILTLVGILGSATEPNGGGWILFFIMIIMIILVPFILLAAVNCITWFIGLLNFKKKPKTSSIFGIISSIAAIVNSAQLFFVGFIFLDTDIVVQAIIYLIIIFMILMYQLLTLILMCISKRRVM